MPVKEIETIVIKFIHDGLPYVLRRHCIYRVYHEELIYICRCDITHLPEYGDEHIMEICAHTALDVYFEQQQEMHQHIKETMEPLFGLYESLKNIFEGGNNK